MVEKLKDRALRMPLTYIILGALVAIVSARTYVLLGGDLNLSYGGVTFHHFFTGAIIVAAIGVIVFELDGKYMRDRFTKSLLAFIFGTGLGMIIDESTLLLVGGQSYTLAQYYSPLNLSIEFGALGLLFALFLLRLFISSFSNKRR
jgi:hypothetical protein